MGLAHSPSFPSYILSCFSFRFVPLGDFAFRYNVATAFFSAMLAVVVYWLITVLSRSGDRFSRIVGFLSALCVTLNPLNWYQSLKAEVYSFNLFLLLIIVILSVRLIQSQETNSGNPFKIWSLIIVIFGIGAGNHSLLTAHLAPALLFLFFITCRRLKGNDIVTLILLLIGMGSIYLYLPIRSATNPMIDTGNPESWFNFVNAVSRRGTYSRFFGNHMLEWLANLPGYAALMQNFFSIPLIVMSLIALIVAAVVHFKIALFLYLAIGSNIALTLMNRNFNANPDTGPAYLMLSTTLMLCIAGWMGMRGSRWLLDRMPRSVLSRILMGVMVAMVIMSIGQWIWRGVDEIGLQEDHSASWICRALLDECGPDAVVFNGFYYNFGFVIDYLRIADHYRRDVRQINRGEVLYWPGGLQNVKTRHWELVKDEFLGPEGPALGYLAPRSSRHSEQIPFEQAKLILFRFLARVALSNASRYPVYWFPSEDDILLGESIGAAGIFLRVTEIGDWNETVARVEMDSWNQFASRIHWNRLLLSQGYCRTILLDSLINLGNSLDNAGQYPAAFRAYHRALEIDGDSPVLHQNLEILLRKHRESN